VRAKPASTYAVEEMFFGSMRLLEDGFRHKYEISLFTHDIDDFEVGQQISRFASKDRVTLLRLAKDIIRVFSDRLNVTELRKFLHTKRKPSSVQTSYSKVFWLRKLETIKPKSIC
jgi:hypothetical protein